MARPRLEVADVFRAHGAAWRKANAGHVSLAQLKVMSAIETCRTAALGGHVERCEDCAHERIAYNSCRNRHCPKCQAAAARRWLEDREAELLPVPYYHVVFTLPAAIGAIAFQNKAAVYDLLFRTAAETLTTIAADPKHLGARIGLTAVLHTWGSALTHHPHVHVIVPGGGLSPDGSRWIACKPGFFLPVRVLSRLFRRLFLEGLAALHAAGRLVFFGDLAPLADKSAFDAALAPLRRSEWVVYAKRPFAGPKAVLAYLSRYTHRVAISNSRLIALDDKGVTFRWKDYRARGKAPGKGLDQADDARGRRVHPPLPSPRAAERLPPHPPLRLPRQPRTRRNHRAPAGPDRGLRRDRSASPRNRRKRRHDRPRTRHDARHGQDLSLLRRSHAHHRDVRPRRSSSQLHRRTRRNQLLMTAAPARAIPDLCSTRTFPGAAPFAPEPTAASNLARLRAAERRAYADSADPGLVRRPRALRKSPAAAVPRGATEGQIPIAARRRRTLTVPRFPPLEAFGRRPSGPPLRSRQGRHPKPSYEGPQVKRQLLVSASSGLTDRGELPANLVSGGILRSLTTIPASGKRSSLRRVQSSHRRPDGPSGFCGDRQPSTSLGGES